MCAWSALIEETANVIVPSVGVFLGVKRRVSHAPRITSRMCLLLLLAFVRGVYYMIEQPQSSAMKWFPYVVYLQKVAKKVYEWLSVPLLLGKIQ